MALLLLEKLKKDINTLFGYVKCLMAKSDENCPLVATEWSSNHSVATGNPYTAGTYVFYNGHVYKCLFNNDGLPPTNTTYWLDLGEGHLLAEEQSDWNATTGRKYILNKPTATSDFTNDGEDGSSPFATLNDLNAAIPLPQDLFSVLNEGDTAQDNDVNIRSIGLYDDFNAPANFAKIFADKDRIYFQNKTGTDLYYIDNNGWVCLRNTYTYQYNFPTITNNRIATWQNKSGVVAFLSDIPTVPVTTNYGLFSQTEESLPVTGLTERTLIGTGIGTLTVPENTFEVGQSFHLKIAGKITNANNQDLLINLKSDALIIGTTGIITIPTTTDKNWELTVDFTVREIGAAGTAHLQTNGKFIYNKNSNNIFEGQAFDYNESVNFDTTVSNTLNITATWLTSNAVNSIHSHQLMLNRIN